MDAVSTGVVVVVVVVESNTDDDDVDVTYDMDSTVVISSIDGCLFCSFNITVVFITGSVSIVINIVDDDVVVVDDDGDDEHDDDDDNDPLDVDDVDADDDT